MRGVSTEFIADAYMVDGEHAVRDDYELTRHELLVALWFEATHGQPRFRKRWKAWVREADGVLWNTPALAPDAVPLPPADH